MLKALGIAGSPRLKGNSNTLLAEVLQGAEEGGAQAEVIHLNLLLFHGCQGCDRCCESGECALKDDLTPYYPALRAADIWVLASPVYFDGVSGQLKLFFDRCRCLTMAGGKLEGRRRAGFILTYEDHPRDDYVDIARRLAKYLPWFGNFGEAELLVEGRLGPADAVSKRPDLLQKARALGRRLVDGLVDNTGEHGSAPLSEER